MRFRLRLSARDERRLAHAETRAWRHCGAVAAALLFVTGCDGCGSPVLPPGRKVVDEYGPSDRAAAVSTAAAKAAAGVMPPKSQDEIEQEKARLEAAKLKAKLESTAPPAARPRDVAAWTHEDMRSAKRDRDVRLLQAVFFLGTPGEKAEENAKLLVELLRVDTIAAAAPAAVGNPDDEEYVPPPVSPSGVVVRELIPGLARAIASALATNKSPTARRAVKEILLGKLTSDSDDRQFTITTIKAMVDNPDAEYEAMLAAVLTNPERLRESGAPGLSAETLQQETVNLLRGTASAEMRAKAAMHLTKPSVPPGHAERLLPLVSDPTPRGVAAQSILAVSPDYDLQNRLSFQRNLTRYAKQVADGLMGVPDRLLTGDDEEGVQSAAQLTQARQEENYRLAEQLWSQRFVEALAARVGGLNGLIDDADLLTIATSIPSDPVRAALYKQLQANWQEGEALSRAPQFSAALLRDPGMLAVYKSLPREDSTTARGKRPANENSPAAQKAARERKAKQAWMSSSATLVTALCRRFEAAAAISRGRGGATRSTSPGTLKSADDFDKLIDEQSGGKSTADGSDGAGRGRGTSLRMPFSLPEGSRILATHHVLWPEDLDGRTTAHASPLVIHYARITLEGQGAKTIGFFENQLKKAEQHPLENGRWIDSLTQPSPGKLRSVDVLVTRAHAFDADGAPLTASRSQANEKLFIDILWIEIADPT